MTFLVCDGYVTAGWEASGSLFQSGALVLPEGYQAAVWNVALEA